MKQSHWDIVRDVIEARGKQEQYETKEISKENQLA
jgi:hypothetical protein